MDDFTLSLCGGFPAQEVIVGGDYSLGGDLSPDISHFVGQEEIIFEDIDSGLTSNSDDLSLPSFTSSSHHEDEDIINVRLFFESDWQLCFDRKKCVFMILNK